MAARIGLIASSCSLVQQRLAVPRAAAAASSPAAGRAAAAAPPSPSLPGRQPGPAPAPLARMASTAAAAAAAAASEAAPADGAGAPANPKRPPGVHKRTVALHVAYVGTGFSGGLQRWSKPVKPRAGIGHACMRRARACVAGSGIVAAGGAGIDAGGLRCGAALSQRAQDPEA